MTLSIGTAASIVGELRPPSDKSLTHRAYMLGAIARGESLVRNPLAGEDCEATLRCLQQMGLQAVRQGADVRLKPAAAWTAPSGDLDCGNSGTTMRLLAGLIASRDLTATLTGDASLSRRPMKRIAEPLAQMGARIEGDTPPLTIHGTSGLHGIRFESPVSSAQVKSCVLLAGLRASGETWVREPSVSRDHTERMLRAVGVPVMQDPGKGVGVAGGATVEAFDFSVPSDISSAAFFMVAAALLPGSDLRLIEVGVNPTRTGILDVFQQVGIEVRRERETEEMGEPVADLFVGEASSLRPFQIGGDLVPRLLDEIPVLAVLATQCGGTSRIRDAAELRVKESDRIAKVAEGLRLMGARVNTFEDGMDIDGPCDLRGTTIEAGGDHRIAMAFAVAGLLADGRTIIRGAESIATSFPRFEQDLRRLSVV